MAVKVMNKWTRFFQIELLILNFVIIAGICGFLHYTTTYITRSYNARFFLERIQTVPLSPLRLSSVAILLFSCLVITFILRERKFPGQQKFIAFTLVIDFIVSLSIVLLLDFNYSGIILCIFANLLAHLQKGKARITFMIVAILTYFLADFELIVINYDLFSIDDYIRFYSTNTQQYLLGIYNILISLNILSFIAYCIQLIRVESSRADEIHELYGELQLVNAELKKYTIMAEKTAQTKERNRLAREIHDTLGHTLTGISAGLDACVAMIETTPFKVKKQLEILSNITRKGIKETRRSVHELRPDGLERFGLENEIIAMVEETNAITDLHINYIYEIKHLRFDEDEENTIYRIVQEGITNAIRHGRASKIDICMVEENFEVCIHMRDNGIGCTKIQDGFGTKYMKERIHMLGGNVEFDGSDGFTIDAKIPIRWGKEYD